VHSCPGRCGARVPRHLYACRGCWSALPVIIRAAITAGYAKGVLSTEHCEGMDSAREWYDSRPR
jgi:hypothetical protein